MLLMTDADRDLVRRLAAGDQSVRDQAIAAYRAARERGVSYESDAAMRFMFEIDNSVPDPTLRKVMRDEVLRAIAG